jgi:hypothetical protein
MISKFSSPTPSNNFLVTLKKLKNISKIENDNKMTSKRKSIKPELKWSPLFKDSSTILKNKLTNLWLLTMIQWKKTMAKSNQKSNN